MYDSRQWTFIADMDYSGSVTISDLGLWYKWLFFYPGDYFLSLMIDKTPKIVDFFEITVNDYGGFLSGGISVICCFALIFGFIGMFEDEEEKSVS